MTADPEEASTDSEISEDAIYLHDATSDGGEEEHLQLAIGDFVVTKLLGKKSVKYFVAKVIYLCNDGDVEVSYIRTSSRGQSFYYPDSSDEAVFHSLTLC